MTNTQHTIDATDKSLGRLASEVAVLLRGKNDASFMRHLKPTNKVKVVNASKIKFTGDKLNNKIYNHHTGYPGGLKSATLGNMLERKGIASVLEKAVYGMLPDNKLRAIMMKNLNIND